jgi:hypothetical protein
MTAVKDPIRLSVGGSPEVQELLRTARGDVPTRAQLDHLALRLTPISAAPAAGTLGLVPWVIAATVVIGAIAVVWWTRDREPKTITVPVVLREPARAEAPPAPAPVVEPPSPTPVTTPAVIVEPKPARPRKLAPVPPAPVIAVETPSPAAIETPSPAPVGAPRPREMELLGPAHEALRTGDVARALELATRHRDLYPSGSMREEREAIAIEALARRGDREAAGTRFQAFTVTFPRSLYRERLGKLFEH